MSQVRYGRRLRLGSQKPPSSLLAKELYKVYTIQPLGFDGWSLGVGGKLGTGKHLVERYIETAAGDTGLAEADLLVAVTEYV